MSLVERVPGTAPAWDITLPAPSAHLPGITMVGFDGGAGQAIDLQIVPYPAVTITVDVDRHHHLFVLDEITGRRTQGSVAAGLGPSAVRCGGSSVASLKIRLSPLVAYAVFGESTPREGTVVPLADLCGPEGEQIQDSLIEASSWEERFAIASSTIGRRVAEGRAADPEVAYVWNQITAHQGQVRIDDLAAEVGWGRQRLWSRFRAQVGTTPKRAAQLVRFDHAAHRLAAGDPAAWVAAEAGYADQSHLNREVMAFTRMTPTALSAAPWLSVDMGFPFGMHHAEPRG